MDYQSQARQTHETVITPAEAQRILDNFMPLNRNVRPYAVEAMSRAMTAGEWKPTHQGLAFNVDGHLIDGQHRLRACVASGVSLSTQVTVGLALDTVEVIDTGKTRTDGDLHLFKTGERAGQGHLATAHYLQGYDNARRCPAAQRIAFLQEHEEAIKFACEGGGCTGIVNAILTGVIARAWYHEDRPTLRRFREILVTGVGQDKRDSTVQHLRTFLLSKKAPRGNGGLDTQNQHLKIERALLAFLNGQELKKIIPLQQEQWLLPGETR